MKPNWKRWLEILIKIISPPVILLIFLTILSTAALIAIFVNGWETTAIAYVTYPLSAYTLTALCYCIAQMHLIKRTKQVIYGNSFGNRYMTDTGFKARVNLRLSLAINLIFSVLKLLAGIYYSSIWLGAVGIYYGLLATLRFLIFRYMKWSHEKQIQDPILEYRRFRLCGYVLTILHIALIAIVVQMVLDNRNYAYPGILIFAVAAYTFWSVTTSIISLIRYRKYKSPMLSATKIIGFASALVSLLALETAMITQFGEDESFRQIMVSLTGAAVCMTVLGLSNFMIIRSNQALQKLQSKL